MTVLGTCAYCGHLVHRGVALRDEAPVVYGCGFYELRTQGGGNAFVGGVERKGRHIWHRACAIKHRDEHRHGRQESLL